MIGATGGVSCVNLKMEIKLQNKQDVFITKAQDFGLTAKTEFLVGSGDLGLILYVCRIRLKTLKFSPVVTG